MLVARALDRWWDALGRPDPFLVVEGGAGSGRLAASVLAAAPACSPALRYVLVERSARLRAEQRDRLPLDPPEDALGPFAIAPGDDAPLPVAGSGPVVTALDELPVVAGEGVVLANELLDNLPFDVVERTAAGWTEIRVGLDRDRFVEVPVPVADPPPVRLRPAFDAPVGARLPVQSAAEEWIGAAARLLRRGVVTLVDYGAPAADLAARGPDGWLRTYRAHARGGDALDRPGTQDVTTDVVTETLRRAAARAGLAIASEVTQAEWLGDLGVEELVADGRRTWAERAHLGDLAAVAGRSRAVEAAALTDPAGLGAHVVTVLTRGEVASPAVGVFRP